MYPFAFKVITYDDGEYKSEFGMGLAESFSDAMKQLEGHFGEELMTIKHLELFEASSIISMPKDAAEEIINETYHTDKYFDTSSKAEEKDLFM